MLWQLGDFQVSLYTATHYKAKKTIITVYNF